MAILLLLAIPVYAKTDSMKLLAVSEEDEGLVGMLADLSLEIKQGTGRVFIDTFPITKLDTQLTTRYAKEVACNNLKVDCSKYDFFYHIKAPGSIIGGPSGGAATTVLTMALLSNTPLDKDVAMTGTINSGELIGPVGGTFEKVQVAAHNKFHKVLIPSASILESNNFTFSTKDLENSWGIEVKEVVDVDEAFAEFTGKKLFKENPNVEIASNYRAVIEYLAEDLCNRSQYLIDEINDARLNFETKLNEDQLFLEESAYKSLDNSKSAFKEDKMYSSASYCFGANVNLQIINVLQRNHTLDKRESLLTEVNESLRQLESYAKDYEIKTMTDLQAYMIVLDRVLEAKELVERAEETINITDSYSYNIAFGIERIYSGYSWAKFLGTGVREFNFNEDKLRQSCANKIAEAEERFQYALLFVPYIDEQGLEAAKKDMKNENYALCLFKATKAKAQFNVVLSTIGVTEKQINQTIKNKIDAAKKLIVKQTNNDVFPILGFSYYEYTESLLESEDYSSALLYSEYALELSDLGIYFESKSYNKIRVDLRKYWIYVLLVLIGFILGAIVHSLDKKRPRNVYVKLR